MANAGSGPVVAGADYSAAAEGVIGYAAWEARRRGVGLRLVHGFVPPTPEPVVPWPPYDDNELLVAAEARLAEAAVLVRANHRDLPVTTKVVAGSGGRTLVNESRTAELVVVGARGEGGFDHLLLGSAAAQVAQHARCPVIVVRPPHRPEGRLPGRGRVVVGVDGSAQSAATLRFAFDEAAARGVPLVAVHVWSVPAMSARSLGIVWSRNLTSAREQLRGAAGLVLTEALAGWSDEYPQVDVEYRSVHGDESARTLLEIAVEVEADLIVVGAREPDGTEAVLSSVAQTVVAHATASVAVVHQDR